MWNFFKRKKNKRPVVISPKPEHVAVIMDGNGRWANAHGLSRVAGHKRGVDAVKSLIKSCIEHEIPYLSIFAFSSENWSRPEQEVSALMELFLSALGKEAGQLAKNGIRLKIIGQREQFPRKVVDAMDAAEASTEHCQQMQVTVAASYGGHWDIVQSVRELAKMVASGELDAQAIDQQMIEKYLSTAGMPTPDLMIRTGGEQRISNFLIWQLAYTELYFSEKYWPEMDDVEFENALTHYQHRERRFGKISEQLTGS